MNFDATREAEKSESLAKERIDEGQNPRGEELSKSMLAEWLSLNKEQRVEVARVLDAKYNNHWPDTLPVARVGMVNGEPRTLEFEAAFFDTKSQIKRSDVYTYYHAA